MKSDNVAEYLQQNPEFFNEHAEILAGITLPHPHGGRTISLSERQLLVLRERVKELEKKLHDLLLVARENDTLQNKLHQYTLSLIGVADLPTLHEAVMRNLREVFSIPHAQMQIWKEALPNAEVMAFADQHTHPICAHEAVHDTRNWFGETGEHLRSFAYLPLRNDAQSIGMLILASEDVQRFYPEMGTMFLQRIAELVARIVLTLQAHE